MLGKRLTNLLSLLSQDDYQTAEQLALKLQVSSKTVRNLLIQLDDDLKDNGAHIMKKHGVGYRLEVADIEKLNHLLCKVKAYLPDSSMERVQYLLEYFLNHRDYVKTEDLSEMICVCKKTLAVDLKEVEKLLKKYDVSLERKPYYGMRVVGDEFHIRLCIAECTEIKQRRNSFRMDEETNKELSQIADCLIECFDRETYHISDVALQNLIVHMHIAVKRIVDAHYVPMKMNEYEQWIDEKARRLAKECADKLGDLFHMSFPEEEVAYMAIHLAGKQGRSEEGSREENIVIDNEIGDIVTTMLEEVYQVFRIDLRNDLELIISLGKHLVPLKIRIRYGMKMKNPLLKDIKERFSLAYTMATQACGIFKQNYGKELDADEIGYIALAFALALERQRTQSDKKSILLVCSSGVGSAKLLSFKLKDLFEDCIENIQTCDARSVGKMDFSKIDYVFTTVPICTMVPVPICEVKYFLQSDDIDAMRKMLKSNEDGLVAKYYPQTLFFTKVSATDKEEAIRWMCTEISKERELPKDFYQAIMKREKMAKTAFGNMVAMPHPYKAMTKETFVSVCILNEPIAWDENQKVQVIFLVSIADAANKEINDFYRVTSKLLLSRGYVIELIKKSNYTSLVEILHQIERTLEEEKNG